MHSVEAGKSSELQLGRPIRIFWQVSVAMLRGLAFAPRCPVKDWNLVAGEFPNWICM